VISGGDGPDQIDGGEGNDRLQGGSDEDEISGGLGDDIAYGGPGADTWDSGRTADGDVDRFYGGSGRDTSFGGERGRQILRGERGDDNLGGGEGDDLIFGGSGDDLLYPAEGDDDVRGGTGMDTVDYAEGGVSSGVPSTADYPRLRVDLQLGKATGLGDDRLRSVEGVIGGSNADVLLGSRRANLFYLSDALYDLPDGRSVEDLIDGRGGDDTIGPSYFGCCGIVVDLAKGTARMAAESSSARLTSVEGAIGTYWEDDLRGDDRANTFRGLEGADVIRARGGSDRIWGDKGGEVGRHRLGRCGARSPRCAERPQGDRQPALVGIHPRHSAGVRLRRPKRAPSVRRRSARRRFRERVER
jgi:Ca2+-binding RTX toxin-like protein